MKKKLFILFLIGCSFRAWGDNADISSTPVQREVESNWPGVQMQVFEIDRIPGNRLLVGIRLLATSKAPSSTFIGIPAVIPPNATAEDIKEGYHPSAFSLNGSTMIEELSHVTYDMLPPADDGLAYRPARILASLRPGEGLIMSVQFPVPPPPPPNPDGTIPKQTVSILLPNAKGPITHIVVPPEKPEAPTASP